MHSKNLYSAHSGHILLQVTFILKELLLKKSTEKPYRTLRATV